MMPAVYAGRRRQRCRDDGHRLGRQHLPNENALKKLRPGVRHSFGTNVQTLVPILSDHISQKKLGWQVSVCCPHPAIEAG